MKILRQKEYGNKENKAAKRAFEIAQGTGLTEKDRIKSFRSLTPTYETKDGTRFKAIGSQERLPRFKMRSLKNSILDNTKTLDEKISSRGLGKSDPSVLNRRLSSRLMKDKDFKEIYDHGIDKKVTHTDIGKSGGRAIAIPKH